MDYLQRGTSHWTSLEETEVEPIMAPQERLDEFETEVDAINYCVDQAVRNRRGLTHMQLADDMRITRAVMTKMRQGQVAVPVSKFVTFIRKTGNFALLQFYAAQFGLVLKKKHEINADARKIAQLQKEVDELRAQYTGVIGRGN